ncbi:MAG: hypothetical protein DCC68_04550 [Planctomycetota bacterium]|nr:MAG: hypothetical protein DCC68_04550 [Planctomycetota bacterium]
MPHRSILPAVWEIPAVFRDRLGTRAGRQRAMIHEGHVLLVLHRPPKPDEEQREGRFFWRKPDGTWLSSESGGGLASLEAHIQEYADLVERYDQREERATTAAEYFDVIQAVTPIHRAARNLHQVLQDARKAVPEDRDLIDFRDRAYDIERNAELLYTDTKNGLDYALARRAEEQAAAAHKMSVAAHRLNVLAAFFFPIATLSAVFGVNLQHGWENAPGPGPFVTLLAAGLVCGFLLKGYITRAE